MATLLVDLAALIVVVGQLPYLNPIADSVLPFYIALVILLIVGHIVQSRKHQPEEDALVGIVRERLERQVYTRITSVDRPIIVVSVCDISSNPAQSHRMSFFLLNQDASNRPNFSGYWKRTKVVNEEALAIAQDVPYVIRVMASMGEVFQKLGHTEQGLSIHHTKNRRSSHMEYKYGISKWSPMRDNRRLVLLFVTFPAPNSICARIHGTTDLWAWIL